jgi:hypothetical protein
MEWNGMEGTEHSLAFPVSRLLAIPYSLQYGRARCSIAHKTRPLKYLKPDKHNKRDVQGTALVCVLSCHTGKKATYFKDSLISQPAPMSAMRRPSMQVGNEFSSPVSQSIGIAIGINLLRLLERNLKDSISYYLAKSTIVRSHLGNKANGYWLYDGRYPSESIRIRTHCDQDFQVTPL